MVFSGKLIGGVVVIGRENVVFRVETFIESFINTDKRFAVAGDNDDRSILAAVVVVCGGIVVVAAVVVVVAVLGFVDVVAFAVVVNVLCEIVGNTDVNCNVVVVNFVGSVGDALADVGVEDSTAVDVTETQAY